MQNSDIGCLDWENKETQLKYETASIFKVSLLHNWTEVGQSVPTLSASDIVMVKQCNDPDDKYQLRFLEAYKRLKTCKNKNIITAHFSGTIDCCGLYAMEVGEQSLYAFLNHKKNISSFPTDAKGSNEGSYTMSHCMSWVKQIANGLAYLHDKGIIHRDVKAANVLLFENSTLCKLCDFDDCTYIRSEMTPETGTPNHMAPEVATRLRRNSDEKIKYTEKCDCYSFGVTALEVIFRRSTQDMPNSVELQDADDTVRWYITEEEFQCISLQSSVFDYTVHRTKFAIVKNILNGALSADPKRRPSAQIIFSQLELLDAETNGKLPELVPQTVDADDPDRHQDSHGVGTNRTTRSVSNKSCTIFYTLSLANNATFDKPELAKEIEDVLNVMGRRVNTRAAKDPSQPYEAKHRFKIVGKVESTQELTVEHSIGHAGDRSVAEQLEKYCREDKNHLDWLVGLFKGDNNVSLRSLRFSVWKVRMTTKPWSLSPAVLV